MSLTKAHVSLSHRPALGEQGRRALQRIEANLMEQLQAPIEKIKPWLVDGAFDPWSRTARTSVFALLELSALGTRAALEVERPLLGTLIDLVAGGPGRPAVHSGLTRIEEAAFGYLVLVCLAAAREEELIERSFGPRLLGIMADRSELLAELEKGAYLAIDLTVSSKGTGGLSRLVLPARPLHRAVDRLPPALATAPSEELLAARIDAGLFTTAMKLCSADLAALARGDVVLLESLGWTALGLEGPVSLHSRTFRLRGQLASAGFFSQRADVTSMPTEVQMPSSHTDITQPFPVLPVEVEVELKRIQLSIAQLGTLKPGSVLPMRIDPADPVVLRVGQRAIARAELVDVEGEVGARVLELLP